MGNGYGFEHAAPTSSPCYRSSFLVDPILPRVGESGGVLSAVRALQAFPSDGRVALSCTQLLRHLSRNGMLFDLVRAFFPQKTMFTCLLSDLNKERLAVAGCLPVIAATAGAHLPSIKIQENVLSVIGNMSYRPDNRTIIAGVYAT